MSKKRGAFGGAAVGSKLVAAGGFWDGPRPKPAPFPTSGGALALVEVYDPETDEWTAATPLEGPRTTPSSAVTDGTTLWLAGGEDDNANQLGTLEEVHV